MEFIEIIGQDQYNRIAVDTPEALLRIGGIIDDINKKKIGDLGLADVLKNIQALNDVSGQLIGTYDKVTKAQKDAVLASQRLAKAEKDRADANLKNAKADEIRLKTTLAQTKADQDSAKAIDAKTKADLKNRSVNDIPFNITNETQVILSEVEAQKQLAAAQALEAAEAREAALAQAAYSAQEIVVTETTTAATIAQKAQNEAIAESAGSATTATVGVKQLWSGLRQLAYILPGVGIAGLFSLAGDQIMSFLTSFKSASSAIKLHEQLLIELSQAQSKQQLASEASAATESANAKILYGSATDLNLAYKNRVQAVDELQKKYPAYFGNLTQEAILTGKAKDQYNELNKAIIDKIALEVQEEGLKKLIEQQVKLTEGKALLNKEQGITNSLITKQNALAQGGEQFGVDAKTRSAKEGINKIDEELLLNQKAQDDTAKSILDTQEKLSKLLQKPDQKTKDTSAKDLRDRMRLEDQEMRNRLAAEKEASDIERDRQNALSEENIQTNKEIYEDDTKSLDMRLEAYAEFYAGKNRQAEADAAKEKADLIAKQQEIERIEGKAPGTLSIADKALLSQKQNVSDRLALIDYQTQAKIVANQTQAAKDIVAINLSYNNAVEKNLQNNLAQIKQDNADIYDDQLQQLNDSLAKQEISVDEYNKRVKEIQKDRINDDTNEELEAIKKVQENQNLSADEQKRLINDIKNVGKDYYDQLKELSNRNLADQIKIDKELLDSKKLTAAQQLAVQQDLAEKQKQLAQHQQDLEFQLGKQALQSIQNIYDGQSQARIDALQKQSDALTDDLQLQIDAINASGDSATEKEKKIQEAQAITAAKQKAIADEENKQKRKQAVFDKAAAITNIILLTAQAILAELAKFGPAAAFLAAGIGAIQLAAAAAAPIPQYMYGTDYHPNDGFAIVGDGGERELVEQDGKQFWTPATDTLMYLKKGAKVTPEHELTNNAMLLSMSAINGGSQLGYNHNDASMDGVRSDIQNLTKEVKNKKHVTVHVDKEGLKTFATEGNSWTEYIGKKFNV